jgi:hypothetical protein
LQVEQQLQQINRNGSSSTWTIAQDRELLSNYWSGVAQARIRLATDPKKSAKDRLRVLKLHLTDHWYIVHTRANQRPEFSKRQARLYIRALRACLQHINHISNYISCSPATHPFPPKPPTPQTSPPPLSPPVLPPELPPCNHPKHVQLWKERLTAVFPHAAPPSSPLNPRLPPLPASPPPLCNTLSCNIPASKRTKRMRWTVDEDEELDQFCQRAETSATPTAFNSVCITNRSKDAARLHRQTLGSPFHTNVNRGKHQRAFPIQVRDLVASPTLVFSHSSLRRQLVQKQARNARVMARRQVKHMVDGGNKLFDTPYPYLRCAYQNSTQQMPPLPLPYEGWHYFDPIKPSDLDLLQDGKPLPRPPLPTDAVIDRLNSRVRMPMEWAVTLTPSSFMLPGNLYPSASYSLADVRADTTIGTIADDIKCWLKGRKDLRDTATKAANVQLHLLTADNGLQALPPQRTAQEVDLYNQRHRLIATQLPRAPDVNDLANQRLRAQQAAYNNRPDAPEHTAMLNNLLGERANPAPSNANLPHYDPQRPDGGDYHTLETHLRAITATCVSSHPRATTATCVSCQHTCCVSLNLTTRASRLQADEHLLQLHLHDVPEARSLKSVQGTHVTTAAIQGGLSWLSRRAPLHRGVHSATWRAERIADLPL